jgi:lipid A ethanolaminephosphotransferase
MAVRLFHLTEFAESALLTPQAQREATHPFILLLAIGTWLATATNLPLWFALLRETMPEAGRPWWLGAGLVVLGAVALCAGLTLVAWRWTLKPVLISLLLLAALNTHLMLKHGMYLDAAAITRALKAHWPEVRTFVSWQLVATVTILGVLPAMLVWRQPLRRRTPQQVLRQNLLLLGLLGGLLFAWWHLATPELFHYVDGHRSLLNPFNSLLSLGSAL